MSGWGLEHGSTTLIYNGEYTLIIEYDNFSFYNF